MQTTRGNIRAVLPDPTAAINVNPWTFEQEVVETNAAVEFDTFSVDGLAVRASRLANFGDGDRAFVMVDKLPDPTQAVFAMVDSDAELETDAPYPDGWKPLIPSQIVLPPNRQNPAERFQGQQFSTFQMPAAADATAAYTFAENADGTQAAIVKLTAVELDALAQDKPSRKAHSFLTTSVIPLDGIFPMPCAAIQGLAQRASLVTDSIGFAASETLLRGPVREANGEFCVGGGVALLDSSTDAVSYYAAPGPIDARRGRFQVGSYMIYPNADHASTEPASKLYVFDMAAKTWRTIDNLDGAAGFTFNNNTVTVGNWLFALATDGPQNRSGNQGVLGIDIDKGTTRHYNSDGGRVFARGTRGSAIQFMGGYVIAKVQDPGVMPMTPQPPERITYWNFATKEKAVVELPEDAVFIARRQGPGQNVVNAWTVSQESMCISAVLFDREAAKYLQTVCFPGYR